MLACIRADASARMGTGHVMRCLTLAHLLKGRDAEVEFISRPHPGHLCDHVEKQGFRVHRLSSSRTMATEDPATWLGVTAMEDVEQTRQVLAARGRPADWLVMDHYALGAAWSAPLRAQARHVMVIDDLANRAHDCDLILDQNYYRDLEHRYDGLVPARCRKLLGPKYALLREEFVQARARALPRNGHVRNLLVFLGGADPDNQTGKVLEALRRVDAPGLQVEVVVGASNPHHEALRAACAAIPGVRFHRQVGNMAQLMLAADLAIGAGGATTWERCLLGLPSLTLVIAENQRRTTEDLAGLGLTTYLGEARSVGAGQIAAALGEAMANPDALRDMSARALDFMARAGAPALKAMTDQLFEALPA